MFLNTTMSTECSILNIPALGLLAQSISFFTDFTIHKLSSLSYTSQVYFFKYGLQSLCSLVTNSKELTYNKRKWHSNINPESVKCLMHSQQLPHVSCGAGALIKGCFGPVLVVCLIRQKQLSMAATSWVRIPLGSCLGDMAVRMPDRGLVFERVTCFYCSKRVT